MDATWSPANDPHAGTRPDNRCRFIQHSVARFDTAFHRTTTRVAKLLPIPRRYAAKGVEHYGFHGLSYAYLMKELGRLDHAAAKGQVILAHLGNGTSMAAVLHGKSIDTSIGVTPSAVARTKSNCQDRLPRCRP